MNMKNLVRVAAQYIGNDVRLHTYHRYVRGLVSVLVLAFALAAVSSSAAGAQERATDVVLDSLLSNQPCSKPTVTVHVTDEAAAQLQEREICVLVSSALSQLPKLLREKTPAPTDMRIARVTVQLVDSYSLRLRWDSTRIGEQILAGSEWRVRVGEQILAGSEWRVRVDLDEPSGSAWVMFDRHSGRIWQEWRPTG